MVVVLFALAGCATSGTGRGLLEATGKPGEAPGSVQFVWRAEPDATNGTISATLPDGRVFSGRFVSETSATRVSSGGDPFLGSYGYTWPGSYGRSDAPYWIHSGGGSTIVRTYTGRVSAVLVEPGGERMSCEFELTRPTEGPAAGGSGACQTSGGEQITSAVLQGE